MWRLLVHRGWRGWRGRGSRGAASATSAARTGAFARHPLAAGLQVGAFAVPVDAGHGGAAQGVGPGAVERDLALAAQRRLGALELEGKTARRAARKQGGAVALVHRQLQPLCHGGRDAAFAAHHAIAVQRQALFGHQGAGWRWLIHGGWHSSARIAALTPEEQTWAAIAWRYFVNNTQPQTGLVNGSDKQPRVTLWQMGDTLIALLAAWDQHDWPALFMDGAVHWREGRIAIAAVVGHALLEQALLPGRLLVGKCVVVQGDDDAACVAGVAAAIARGDVLEDPLELRPLPLAGIPGWHPGQDAAFYAQADYFRPLRNGRTYPPPGSAR